MSSPKFDITTGQITIPADGKFLSNEALYEALESELSGLVWQITRRKKLPEGVFVEYRALPKHQWAWAQKHLSPKSWPLLPQQEKHRRDLRTRHRVEMTVMLISCVLFGLLIWGGALSYLSNRQYQQGLTSIIEGRLTRQHAQRMEQPQALWIAQLNALTMKLSLAAISVDGFEVDSSGGKLFLNLSQSRDIDLDKLLEAIWPDVTFTPREEGVYQWSW